MLLHFQTALFDLICLSTLLLQPELPSHVLLDEPELGLQPAAITVLANKLSSAATALRSSSPRSR